MTRNLPPPITPKTFEKMVAKWARIARFNESGSIYYYSKADFLRRFHQLLNNKELYQKYFGNQKISLIDTEAFVLEEEEDWQAALTGGLKQGSRIFFIIGMDNVLTEKNLRVLTFLEEKEAKNPELSFLFFFNIDFSYPNFWSVLKNKTVFIQNTIFHPLYSLKDVRQFIYYLSKKWHLSIDKKNERKIIKQCGGNFWLVKQALRYLRDNNRAGGKGIFNHDQMQWRVALLWEKFLPSEKIVLQKLLKKEKKFNKAEVHSRKFLEKTGWIKKGKDLKLTIPLLEKFIEENLSRVKLEADNKGRIFLNNVSIEKNFSFKEKQVLNFLLKNRNKLVSREKIAQALWQENWEKNYSDWAIDQTISRLRKRLSFLGILPRIMKTVRRRGFILSMSTLEDGNS